MLESATQQPVHFAQFESSSNRTISCPRSFALQKTAQQTQALAFVGVKIAVEGKTAELKGNNATWGFLVNKPATATVNVANSAGATVYTGTFSVNAGAQNFAWDGRSKAGVLQAAGTYTLSVTARDASGQTVVTTEIEGAWIPST